MAILTGSVLPALACALAGGAAALAVRAVRDRRWGWFAVLTLVAVTAGFKFWDWMDAWWVICAAMVGVSFLIVGLSTRSILPGRSPGIPVLAAVLAAWLPILLFQFVTAPFRMWDEVSQQIRSPDGAYEARLVYKDGLTFGFQYVSLQRRSLRSWMRPTEVIEVADEGLNGIEWKDARTLLVQHSLPDNSGVHPEEDQWVLRPTSWGKVRIVYERLPDEGKQPGN